MLREMSNCGESRACFLPSALPSSSKRQLSASTLSSSRLSPLCGQSVGFWVVASPAGLLLLLLLFLLLLLLLGGRARQDAPPPLGPWPRKKKSDKEEEGKHPSLCLSIPPCYEEAKASCVPDIMSGVRVNFHFVPQVAPVWILLVSFSMEQQALLDA